MARGTQLSKIREMLKAEIGDFSGTNAARDSELNVKLSNKQQQYAKEYDWSFLERRWEVAAAAGTRFYVFPTVDADLGETAKIDLDMLDRVEVFWCNTYLPVLYGIGKDEYNFLNPSLNQAADPIRRWREASNPNEATGANQFEVWPVPVGSSTIRFTGNRQLLPLSADADKADLDDMLLVLGVAVDILMRDKQPDAQVKAQMLVRHLRHVGARNQTRDVKRILGQGMPYDGDRKDVKLVAIH